MGVKQSRPCPQLCPDLSSIESQIQQKENKINELENKINELENKKTIVDVSLECLSGDKRESHIIVTPFTENVNINHVCNEQTIEPFSNKIYYSL